MDYRKEWEQARNHLVSAVSSLGYPAELAQLMARQLQSPRAIERMTAYVYQSKPRSEAELVDEMLSICAEIDAWRAKKESQNAQPTINEWIASRGDAVEET